MITPEKDDMRVFRLSVDGNALIPVEGVPAFEVDVRSTNNEAGGTGIHLSEEPEKGDDFYALRSVENMRGLGRLLSVARRFIRNISGNCSNGNPVMQRGKILDWWIPVNSSMGI